MRKTDACHHVIFLPNPRKRRKVTPFQQKPFPAAGGREKKELRREDTGRLFFHRHLFRLNTHTFPFFLPFAAFFKMSPLQLLLFPSFRAAAVNMRSTPDTNQPPLIITGATKQQKKYRRGERRDEGWKRGSLCRVSGAVKWLDAA